MMTLVTVEQFLTKINFHFIKIRFKTLRKIFDPLDYDLFASKTQKGDVGKNSALLSAVLGGA